MEDKILCVLAGYNETTEKHLVGIQNELYKNGFVGTQTKDLLQHITLGTFSVDKEEELVYIMKCVAKENRAFDITFNHIGIFGGSKVLFIAPDSSQKLLNLKENFGDSYGWTPHTTMLIDEPEIIFEAVSVISEIFSAFQGEIETLHLYEFWPTRHILSVSLLHENQGR